MSEKLHEQSVGLSHLEVHPADGQKKPGHLSAAGDAEAKGGLRLMCAFFVGYIGYGWCVGLRMGPRAALQKFERITT